jgi:hypothetical protein
MCLLYGQLLPFVFVLFLKAALTYKLTLPKGYGKRKKSTEPQKQTETPKSTQEKFLSEIKAQYTQRHELRKGLDEKTDKMITLSSAITTLLIGIGTFLVSNVLEATSIQPNQKQDSSMCRKVIISMLFN